MNERIQDFGKQAYNAATEIWPINSQKWYEVYNTTFAELIVRECADIADRAEPYKANDNILRHFGIT